MALQGLEWFIVPFVVMIVIIVLFWRWRLRKRRRVLENVILSIIRSRNGATLDDIIVGAYISADEASEILRKYLAKGILRLEDRDGKTIYKTA